MKLLRNLKDLLNDIEKKDCLKPYKLHCISLFCETKDSSQPLSDKNFEYSNPIPDEKPVTRAFFS